MGARLTPMFVLSHFTSLTYKIRGSSSSPSFVLPTTSTSSRQAAAPTSYTPPATFTLTLSPSNTTPPQRPYLITSLSHYSLYSTMPSLRRTNSSPSARPSPYRSHSLSCATQTRTGARSPRRSSGSDTTNRRILADLDWWRVEASQREVRGLSPDEPLRPTTPSSDEEDLDQEEREPLPAPRLLDFAPAAGANAGAAPQWHSMPGGGLDIFGALNSSYTAWSAGEVDLSEASEVCARPLSHVSHMECTAEPNAYHVPPCSFRRRSSNSLRCH
jgi:hypothetical protein